MSGGFCPGVFVLSSDHRHKNLDFMTKDRPEDQQSLSHFQIKQNCILTSMTSSCRYK